MIRKKTTNDIIVLYFVFICFLLDSVIQLSGNAVLYALSIFQIGVVFLYLLHTRKVEQYKFSLFSATIFSLLIIIIVFWFPDKNTIYIRLFVIKFILLVGLLSTTTLTLEELTKFINRTFLIYASLSIVNWLGLIPLTHPTNVFVKELLGIPILTLFGLDGSTADIDSYSALVLIWNLFINKNHKWPWILFSLAVLLLTFRTTPLALMLLSISSYIVIRHRVSAFANYLFIVIVLFIATMWLVSNQDHYLGDKTIYEVAWHATHARSAIWIEVFHRLFDKYTVLELIYGNYGENTPFDFYHINGITQYSYLNPHNNYYLLILRSPIISVLLFVWFLILVLKNFNRKTNPIIMVIALSSLSNSSIIGLGNPIYLIILIYLLSPKALQLQRNIK